MRETTLLAGVISPLLVVAITGLALDRSALEAPTTIRASLNSSGIEGNDHSLTVSISDGGRLVAFASMASNLVDDDVNYVCNLDPRFPPRNCWDIFVRDVENGTTVRVSRGYDGTEALGDSSTPVISGDGRVVAFVSKASNLVPLDTNGIPDVFAWDSRTGAISRVSVASDGSQQGEDPGSSCSSRCGGVSVNRGGRYVVFDSWSSNLVPDDTNGAPDVFVHDRATGTTERVSVSSAGEEGDDASWAPGQQAVSADGRFVVFQSEARNLAAGDANQCPSSGFFSSGRSCIDVFLRDRREGRTTLVTVNETGMQGNNESGLAAISPDGEFVAFFSRASNLVRGDANGVADVFVMDLRRAEMRRISIANDGTEWHAESWAPSISEGGRYASLSSEAGPDLAGTGDRALQVYVYEWASGTVVRASHARAGGAANGLTTNSHLDATGAYVAFDSPASDLVDGDANGKIDVFRSNGFHTLFSRGVGEPNGDMDKGTAGAGKTPAPPLHLVLAAILILAGRRPFSRPPGR